MADLTDLSEIQGKEQVWFEALRDESRINEAINSEEIGIVEDEVTYDDLGYNYNLVEEVVDEIEGESNEERDVEEEGEDVDDTVVEEAGEINQQTKKRLKVEENNYSQTEQKIHKRNHTNTSKRVQKTSKWIVYLSENRKKVMEANPSLPFPQITKLIAEEYKQLSPEQIERLEKMVTEINQATALATAAEAEEVGINEEGDLPPPSPAELHIPLARVKKCMKLDPEVKNISKESIALMTKAVELFITKLAIKTQATGALRGGKTIKINDFIHTLHYEPAFEFLTMDFPKSMLQVAAANSNNNNHTTASSSNKNAGSRNKSKSQNNEGEESLDKDMKENAFEENIANEDQDQSKALTKKSSNRKGSTNSSFPPPVSAKNSITNYFTGRKRAASEEEEEAEAAAAAGEEAMEDEVEDRIESLPSEKVEKDA